MSLSVILTSYNKGDYIEQSLEAMVNSSRPPDELLILDDCSTDNSIKIIKKFCKSYSFVHLIENGKNLGALQNINKGLKMANCDYVYAAAADDFVDKRFFENVQGAYSKYPQAGIIFGDYNTVSKDGRVLCESPPVYDQKFKGESIDFLNLILKNPLGFSNSIGTVYKSNTLKFFPKLHHSKAGSFADTFLVYNCALKDGFFYMKEKSSNWRVIPNQFSSGRSLLKTIEMFYDILELMCTEYRELYPKDFTNEWEKKIKIEAINSYISDYYHFGIRKRVSEEVAITGKMSILLKSIFFRFLFLLNNGRKRKELLLQVDDYISKKLKNIE